MAERMGKVSFIGGMVITIKEIGKRAICMVEEHY